jgi:dephospho-CoA kinase
MIRIGLTGTVAAGKSTVGRLFEVWGGRRVDADVLARAAVSPGSTGLQEVVDLFGPEVLGDDGALDRGAVRRRVFGDADARVALERIVHAEVRRLREEWREHSIAEGATVLVEEIPLLFESGMAGDYDAIVVVDAPVEVRRQRSVASRDWSVEEFDAIDASQLEAAEKRRLADHVIWNDGDRESLEEAASAVWSMLVAATDRPGSIDGAGGRA